MQKIQTLTLRKDLQGSVCCGRGPIVSNPAEIFTAHAMWILNTKQSVRATLSLAIAFHILGMKYLKPFPFVFPNQSKMLRATHVKTPLFCFRLATTFLSIFNDLLQFNWKALKADCKKVFQQIDYFYFLQICCFYKIHPIIY